MMTAKPGATYIEKNCKLFLERHISRVRVSQAPQFNQQHDKDMQMNPKLIVDSLGVPAHQLLDPLLSREFRGVVGLSPIPTAAIEPAKNRKVMTELSLPWRIPDQTIVTMKCRLIS